MNRGDVHWYAGPATAAEPDRKGRPVILVSGDAANRNPSYPYVSVVPVTSSVERIYQLELDLEDLLDRPSKAQAQHIFTCRKRDLSPEPVASLAWQQRYDLEARLRKYLDLA